MYSLRRTEGKQNEALSNRKQIEIIDSNSWIDEIIKNHIWDVDFDDGIHTI